MASNMESTFQDFQEDEFFDFDAASGVFADPILPCYTAQNFGMRSFPWNETVCDDATVNNDYQQHGTLANDMFQLSHNFAMEDAIWAEIEPVLQPTGNMTVENNLPDHSNIWDYDSSLFQNGFQISDIESGASAGTHNHVDSNSVAQTILGPWRPIDNHQLRGCIPPSQGHQSG